MLTEHLPLGLWQPKIHLIAPPSFWGSVTGLLKGKTDIGLGAQRKL